jgi:hypothetical protein
MFFSSSPTLSHSFLSLILLQVVDLKLKENGFLLVIIPFFILMVLVGTRHQREEEDSGHAHDDPQYEDDEGFEEDKEGNEGGKASLTPLWRFVTKLEGGRGGGTTKFICHHDCHQGKSYTNSYTHVRHLYGVMETDDNKGAIGISICPKISKEGRQKYIKIEEVAQRKHGKKQKIQSNGSSKFGGNTSPSLHGSRTSGSRRTIADFLDIGGRDGVDAKVARFLYACGIQFNVLHSPYWHDLLKGINKSP